jgi:hypothetical protein
LQNQRKIKESFAELTLNHRFRLALSQYPGSEFFANLKLEEND